MDTPGKYIVPVGAQGHEHQKSTLPRRQLFRVCLADLLEISGSAGVRYSHQTDTSSGLRQRLSGTQAISAEDQMS
jgi:hypothetical protein